MALKTICSLLATSVLVAGCTRPAPTPVVAEAPGPVSVTRWTTATELFAEYPALVTGETSRFAIHLTRLDTFKALTEGAVEVRLEGASGPPLSFRTEAPSRPGIFGVDVTPAGAGKRQLVIVLRSKEVNDEHRVGEVEVYPSADSAREAASGDAEEAAGISFLKEQQWTLDFGTAVVAAQAVRESVRVPARIEARPGGEADVTAPIDGRLVDVFEAPLGAVVRSGQELARLLPPPSVPGDLPQLQRAHSEAEAALTLVTRDRERAERLAIAGAVPARRLEDARAVEAQARARLAAADASLAQYQAARDGDAPGSSPLFVVRAPVGGVIATRSATTGATVIAGSILFRVIDVADVQVVGQIPEAGVARVRGARTAELEIVSQATRRAVGPLVSMGKVLSPDSRTLPITFALDNRSMGLPVGQSVFLHLLTDTTAAGPVVPVDALVDDGGRPIVFVQRAGETFERRAVTVGARTGDLVRITDGVRVGERIVTRGAYLIRLAALSTSVPAHGHVH